MKISKFNIGDLAFPSTTWTMETNLRGTCPPALIIGIFNLYEEEGDLNNTYYKVLIEDNHYFITHNYLRDDQEQK